MKLVGTHALLAGAKQMIGQQPLMKRNMRVLEDRTNCHREFLAASGALPHAFTNVRFALSCGIQLVSVTDLTAMWAGWTIGPALLLKKFTRFIFVTEMLSKIN